MHPVFACDMTAIPAAERGIHHALIRRLMSEAAQDIHGLPDGIAFRFRAEEFDAVAHFVGRERLCCPFLSFALELAPEGGPLWLRLTGPEGAKDFVRAELGLSNHVIASGS